jgi:5-methylcytosine-specific restriction protein B
VKAGFEWADFYTELANKILSFKNNRGELLSKIFATFERVNMKNYLKDGEQDLTDICPFTVMGIFNRGIKMSNRIAILTEFVKIFNIRAPLPESFEGIPGLNNRKAWFFGGKNYDRTTHIDKLWELFETGISLADAPSQDAEYRFAQIFDFVVTQPCSSWNITCGLFWIRPNRYMTLDTNTRAYLNDKLGMNFNFKKIPTGNRYLEICSEIKGKLPDLDGIGSFSALSQAAWMTRGKPKHLRADFVKWLSTQTKSNGEPYTKKTITAYVNALKTACSNLKDIDLPQPDLFYQTDAEEFIDLITIIKKSTHYESVNEKLGNGSFSAGMNLYAKFLSDRETVIPPSDESNVTPKRNHLINQTEYSKDDFLSEVYMTPEKYDDIAALLDRKKNIVLQGAPGVGKSYVAKRIAYSVIGMKDEHKVEMVQFHQSYSYEDFIEGFRPVESGKFEIKKGVFHRFCQKARNYKTNKYFFIIDEINRGNISKIMGELMLLLESDKRGEEFAMPLTYSGERFYVPENVYIIGMMNTADRSLAMIDYALRRRFSFIPIEPAFDNERFIASFREHYYDADTVIEKMKNLNALIARELDSGHQIGHSYFCFDKPMDKKAITGIFEYEIEELLREYFFDNEEMLKKALELL